MVVKTFEYEGMPPGTPGLQTVTRSWGMRPVESVLDGTETTTWAVSLLVESATLVALTVNVPGAAGAVYRPVLSITPPLGSTIDQVTAVEITGRAPVTVRAKATVVS